MTNTEARDAAFDEVRKDIYKETARYTIADDDERRAYFNAGIAQRDKEQAEYDLEWTQQVAGLLWTGKRGTQELASISFNPAKNRFVVWAFNGEPTDCNTLYSAKLEAVKQLKALRTILNGGR